MADEILAHISAPVTRHNDSLYRSLVDAYLTFEPYEHQSTIEPLSPGESGQPPCAVPITPITSIRGILADIPGNTSILTTSKESYGSFPSHFSSEDFMSNFENAPANLQESPSPGDSILMSSRLAHLEHIHQAWKKNTPPISTVNRHSLNRNFALPSSDNPDTAFIEDTQLAAQAIQSQLQEAFFSTLEDLPDDETEIEEELECPVTNDQSHQPKTTGLSKTMSSYISLEPELSSIVAAPAVDESAERATGGVSAHLDFEKLPYDVYPPAPVVSVEQPIKLPSQITIHLATVKAQSAARFRPSMRLRTLKRDERGYWLIQCSAWPAQLQYEFWDTLSENVTSGRLGWSTTLHRDPSSSLGLEHIRLYCWGEVVEYMWLMLWDCSYGKIVGTEARWMDADGIAVLMLP